MSHKLSRVAAELVLASALGICAAAAGTRTASADIVSLNGLVQITAPPLVTGDFLINQGLPSQVIFAERQGVMLTAPLVMDTGVIPAGTPVTVNSLTGTIVNTSVTFSSPILGITYKDGPSPGQWNPNFALSDFLGA